MLDPAICSADSQIVRRAAPLALRRTLADPLWKREDRQCEKLRAGWEEFPLTDAPAPSDNRADSAARTPRSGMPFARHHSMARPKLVIVGTPQFRRVSGVALAAMVLAIGLSLGVLLAG
jgi:hypothetical protein